jgi:4'-phosphopantetheinyl transferase
VEVEYTYGEKGKPALKDRSLSFNLSHSEEYVFGVFADEEVGTDIQYCKPGNHDRMVSRYFSEAEQHALEGCLDVAQKDALFYKIWTRKEAYGKLTGKGITDAIAVDVMLVEGVVWEEYQIGETYQIAVCRFEAEKE